MSQKLLEQQKKVLNRLANHARWYSIKNKAGPVAEVRIYDEISPFGITAEDFVAELDEISAPEMVVAINSPGGSVFDGIAIFNALRVHSAKVTTRVDSMAGSVASVIVQAGDHRIMLTGSQQFIHDAWGLAAGNAADMMEMAELLERQSDNIANIYAERTGRDAAHFRGLMKAETPFSDTESVEEGLADEVVKPSKAEKVAPAARADNVTAQDINGQKLSEHIDSVLTEQDALVHRLAEVVTLRVDAGKTTDETWRTRERVERFESQIEEIRDLLNPPEGTDVPQESPEDELESLKALIEAAAL